MSLKPPSLIEDAAGHLGTEVLFTVIGALSGGPLAALLPVLSSSLASERHKSRIKKALLEIDGVLRQHESAIRDLSDSQYKIINEAVLAVLSATDDGKIEYLRRAVTNSLEIDKIVSQEAVILSRVIRDISAEEADFLVNNFGYDRIQVASSSADEQEFKVLTVAPDSSEALVVIGLTSLGLLSAGEPTYDDSGLLRFSPIVAKLLVLLRAPAPNNHVNEDASR